MFENLGNFISKYFQMEELVDQNHILMVHDNRLPFYSLSWSFSPDNFGRFSLSFVI